MKKLFSNKEYHVKLKNQKTFFVHNLVGLFTTMPIRLTEPGALNLKFISKNNLEKTFLTLNSSVTVKL